MEVFISFLSAGSWTPLLAPTDLPPLCSLTAVERFHFLPPSLAFGKISGFNLRVCVYISVRVCVSVCGYKRVRKRERWKSHVYSLSILSALS